MTIQLVDELADQLVHVFDIRTVEFPFGPRLAVGRAYDRAVDVRHGIVEEKRPVLVASDEAGDELLHDVGQVLALGKLVALPMNEVGFENAIFDGVVQFCPVVRLAVNDVVSCLVAPIAAAAGKHEVFVEAPVAWT